MKAYTKADLIYLAGVMDCDGSFTFQTEKASALPMMCIANTNPDLVFWAKEKFGGRISKSNKRNKHWKPCYIWYLNSKRAIPLAEKVLPFLKLKIEQAKIFMDFGKVKRVFINRYLSEETLKSRKYLIEKLRSLNKRGVD